MKRLLFFILTLFAATLTHAAVAKGPITKITSGPNKNDVTEDLSIPSGRTLKVRGTFDASGAEVIGLSATADGKTLYGTGTPASGAGVVGDTYQQTATPFGTYLKTGVSTWTLQVTPVVTGDARLSDQRVPTDSSVTAAKIANALKPSGGAAAGTEALRALGSSAGTAAAGDDSRIVAVATKAQATSFAALASNALSLTPLSAGDVIYTATWNGTPVTFTYTGGGDTAGERQRILVNVTSTTVLTVTPTSSTVYRNGSTSALGASTLSFPVGRYWIIFITPDTGTNLYMEDTLVRSAEIPLLDAGNYFTTDNVEAALQQLAAAAGAGASVSNSAYDSSAWNSETTVAPSKKAVRDKIVAMDSTIAGLSGGTLFSTEMGVFWPTADIGSIPSGWLAAGSNGVPSFTAIGSYSMIVKSGGSVAAPSFSPAAGTYGSTQSVTISTTTPSAAIRYTTNGTDPTRSSGTVYSTPVSVSSTQTLKAIAYRDYWADTAVQSAAYTISSAPSLSSATINTAGTQLTTNWSASVTRSGSALPTVSASGGASTLSYSSGSPGTATVWGLSRTINAGETVTLSYTQPGNDLEATTGGADVATFSGSAVTNNSTVNSYTQLGYAYTTDDGSASSFGDQSTRKYVAYFFIPTSSDTLSKVSIKMKKVGSPTFNMTVSIYTTVSTKPGAIVSVASGTVAASSLTTTLADIDFTALSSAVTSGTEYWVVLTAVTLGDASNYVQIENDSTASYPGHNELVISSNGTTWNNQANVVGMTKFYKSP